jgi:hypothetical protein
MKRRSVNLRDFILFRSIFSQSLAASRGGSVSSGASPSENEPRDVFVDERIDIPARKFALKAEEKWQAIECRSGRGPSFRDIRVGDNCNRDDGGWTSGFGSVYINEPIRERENLFTCPSSVMRNKGKRKIRKRGMV